MLVDSGSLTQFLGSLQRVFVSDKFIGLEGKGEGRIEGNFLVNSLVS